MSAVLAIPPGTAAPRATHSWWRYVERARAHEVVAQWTGDALAVRESAPSVPDAVIDERHLTQRPWEARLAIWLLEGRLAQMGEYWRARSADPTWRQVLRPVGTPSADPRRNEVVDPIHAPLVHHYHDARGGGDKLVAALSGGGRYVVLRAELDVPSLDVGRIDLLHPRLPDTLSKSVVLREQMALTHTGMAKLVSREDYRRAFGEGGERRACRLVDEVIGRVRDGQFARPPARLDESDAYAEFLVTLNDTRLLALHARFLRPGEEAALLASGAIAIRHAIRAKRAEAGHDAQHLITILEASLLARERLRTGALKRGDPEVRALTRLAYYL